MITKDTALFLYHVAYSDTRVLWTWQRMMYKTVQEWHHACPIKDDWGYNQDISFTEN